MTSVRRALSAAILLASTLLLASCHGGPGITVTINPTTAASLDAGGVQAFSAILGNDTANKGVTWVLEISGEPCTNSTNTTNCGTLSNITPFAVTYTAPNVSAALSVTLEAKANAEPSATGSASISIVLDPEFTTTTLPNGANGVPYNQTITITDGVTPYLFKISSGSLPAGLTLNSATGAIVGSPTAPTVGQSSLSSSFTIAVTDNGGSPPITEPFTIVVTPPTVLTLATTSIPQGTIGIPYNASITAHGGVPPYTFSVVGGGNPAPGLVLNASTGQVSGSPTTAGTYSFQVQVQDSSLPTGHAQTATGTVGVAEAAASNLAITTQTLPNGVTGTAYAGGILQVTGGTAPYTWSLVQGQLPSGLSLGSQTNGNGAITGTPVLGGTSTFTVQVQDSEAIPVTKTASFTVIISPSSANNDLLNGQYSFLFKGFDSSGPMAIAGTLTTDGNGNVTTGREDSNRASGIISGIGLTGTYAIGSDGRGTMELIATDPRNTSNTITTDYQLALESSGNVKFFENNSTTTSTDLVGTHGEGILKPVVGSFAASSFSGNYAFEFSGPDFTGSTEALAGRVNADGSNTLSAGFSDLNDAGNFSSQSVSGNFTFASGNVGAATLVFQPPSKSQITLTFAYYFVSPSDLFFVELDTAGTTFTNPPRLSGEMVLQNPAVTFNTSALSGVSVATGQALDNGNATVFAGLLSSTACDGSTPASLAYDQNDAGALSQPVFGGTCSISSNGRVVFTNLGTRAAVAYLTAAGTGFLLGSDTGVTTGLLEQQTPASYAIASFVGEFAVNTAFPVDKQTQNIGGQLNSTGTGNAGGTLDEFAAPGSSTPEGKATLDQTITAPISPVATSGRGTLALSGSPFVGLPTNVIFYFVSPNSLRAISADATIQHPLLLFLDH